MLQSIREKFSGWILIIIMLLLVVPFALFGINNYFQAQIDTFVAKVNDAEIAPSQLQERLDLQRRQMRQMLGQDADISFVDTPDNKRRVLDSLIDEELRVQDARAAGIEIPASSWRESGRLSGGEFLVRRRLAAGVSGDRRLRRLRRHRKKSVRRRRRHGGRGLHGGELH